MAAYEEFTINQGEDVAIELHLVDENDVAKDLANYACTAKMKKSFTADTTYDFSTLVTEPSQDGIITLSMTNTQTLAIPAGRYVYDTFISFVDSDGNTVQEKVLEGRIQVVPAISLSGGGGGGAS